MIPGAVVNLGGRGLTIPALSFGQLRKFGDKIAQLSKLQGLPTDSQISDVLEIAHAAICRNHPEVGADWLENNVDLRNMGELMRAIMGVSTAGEAASL